MHAEFGKLNVRNGPKPDNGNACEFHASRVARRAVEQLSMATRALLTMAATARRGEIIDIELLAQHPMETGYRSDSEGKPLARDLLRRVECRFDGELVFAADLHAAIAANPYLAFTLLVGGSGTLVAQWRGDDGFAHAESARLTAT